MDARSQRRNHQGGTLSLLNAAVETTGVAEERAGIAPVKAAFGSVSALLAIIRDSVINKVDYVELGLACADVCGALDRGMSGRQEDQIGRSVLEAIERLTTTVAEIQRNVDELGNEVGCLCFSTRRKIRTRLLPGGWTSTGSFMSSTYVSSLMH
ncbi:hypothetical protein BDM02DRAFT_3125016 [Thelephora ganbajun]|uniref:Uncharacterized protein n=1 Tax=Thelephora ganbajun TaxID=370292 RepID=A0ACB6YWT9_THEGA|nr:hypothetical protein BDM02DRAFT_3125016 [Thelephora ganbajun]